MFRSFSMYTADKQTNRPKYLIHSCGNKNIGHIVAATWPFLPNWSNLQDKLEYASVERSEFTINWT